MDFLTKFRYQVRYYLLIMVFLENIVLVAGGLAMHKFYPDMSVPYLLLALAIAGLVSTFVISDTMAQYVTQPLATLWQAIQHVAPHGDQIAPPDLTRYKLGRDMVATLANHVYQLASVVQGIEQNDAKRVHALNPDFAVNALPLPILILDGDDKIVLTNEMAAKYLSKPAPDLVGQNFFTALDLSFTSSDTLDSWLKVTKGKTVTSDRQWERVRIGLPGQNDSLLFDLAAHYNQGNPLGYETLLILFDHTETYIQDDQAMSFVALAVHELRTPLTLLRGYIEVFDEELGPTLEPELKEFMKKMDASAQQLAAFVDNILNVAKIEDNQLTLQLHEENWQNVIDTVVRDLSLRAGVRGITIKTDIAPNLPTVGVDRYSIYEVLANLLDNAIKYSKGTSEIYVTASLNSEGQVETSVKDFGLGIDSSILPHIFGKFYRNHRNRAQIGGTGLGLYLCKAIVDAHGGQIGVSSKVNEGSTFTFTVLPFAQITDADKDGKPDVTRSAHGWIKNHSLYRD